MHPLLAQNAFLLELARLEKAQDENVTLCNLVEFVDDAARLTVRERHVRVPLDAEAATIAHAIQPFVSPLMPNLTTAFDTYPTSGTLASKWAELHYRLATTDYLVQLRSAAGWRYTSLHLGETDATVSMARGKSNVTVVVSLDDYPIHPADELAEAIDAAVLRDGPVR